VPSPGSNRAHTPPRKDDIGGRAREALSRLRARLPASGSEGDLAPGELRQQRLELADRRTFGLDDLTALALLLAEGGPVLPVAQLADLANRPDRVIMLRHDMDRDAENSLQFAQWEAVLGHRSSYYVLHSDWYWRGPGLPGPSRFILRILDQIAALGHEIGLHNNAITVGLLTGEDPVRVLDRELTALRRAGFEIRGSVAHGDPICRVAGYVNDEVFLESTHRVHGEADRTIRYTDPRTRRNYEVTIRPVPMAELGLRYEANLVRNIHFRLSDTGGHWNGPFPDIANAFLDRGGTLYALIHPLWWAFGREVVHPKSAIAVPALRRGS
jgi:hypothetical protein